MVVTTTEKLQMTFKLQIICISVELKGSNVEHP